MVHAEEESESAEKAGFPRKHVCHSADFRAEAQAAEAGAPGESTDHAAEREEASVDVAAFGEGCGGAEPGRGALAAGEVNEGKVALARLRRGVWGREGAGEQAWAMRRAAVPCRQAGGREGRTVPAGSVTASPSRRMVWLRLEWRFMSVAATWRRSSPPASAAAASDQVPIGSSRSPSTVMEEAAPEEALSATSRI